MKIAFATLFAALVLGLAPPLQAQENPRPTGKFIAMEVAIIELSQGEKWEGFDPESVAKLVSRLAKLEADGKLGAVCRVRLATTEGQLSSAHFGERGIASSRGGQFGPGGPGGGGRGGFNNTAMLSRSDSGTIVSALPQLDEEGVIVINLQVEKSGQARRPKVAGENPAEVDPNPLPETTLSTKATVRVPNGQTVLAHGQENVNGKEITQTIVLVSARVAERAEKREPKPAAEGARQEIKIFKLRHAAAATLVKALAEVLTMYKDLRISVDERSNSVIASGSADHLAILEALLIRLDEGQ